ncbi:FimV/HubP family polar landmark protein [Pseudomonas sp. CBC3]|uniref:FimV/HubP family polar landmark protein n=1 Tax=Pseudomonas sp. CBC3 TaxID=3123318 RepID=UPI0030E95316
MTLDRRVLLFTALLIYSGMASALGMGDIRLHSALNQPLSAEIDLLDVGELSAEDIRVVLASSSDFARVGVERLAFLQDLSFTPVIDGNRSRIRVASSQPVREPYLNFLVEITRAKSRMLREYTVLLDPMPSTLEAASSVAVVVPQAVASPVHAEPAHSVLPAELPGASQGKRHRVSSGESLWMIASKYVGDAQDAQSQFMRDVLALNPEAFAGGDPARLSTGAFLLLPDTAEMVAAADIAPAEAELAVEAVAQNPSTFESRGTDPVLPDDNDAVLRQQLLDELAAGRAENLQLKQLLNDMRLQLEAVSARLADQESAQAAALLQTERAEPVADVAPQTVAEPITAEQATAEPVSSFRWQDWALPGGAVLASLLLGGLWFARRNKLQALLPQAASVVVAPAAVPPEVSAAAAEMPLQPAHASVSETEVLEAANIYLTYGRRDEALDVLLRGIERAPEQLDLRLRHLGLLAELGDVEEYGSAAASYLQAGGSQAQLQQLLAQHPALSAVEPVPSPPALDVTFVLNETSVAPLDDLASVPAEQNQAIEANQVLSIDSQSWLDAFDETVALSKLPSLVDDAGNLASTPSAEEMHALMANPEHLVRLNQAVAYIKQGDIESACIILENLATDGDEHQRRQVSELLAQIG